MGEVGERPGSRWAPRALALLALAGLAVLAAVLVLGAQAAAAEGETIVVAQDGSGDYTTIQEAIDAAEEGDTIRVWAGTYEENVVVNKTVDLIGNGSTVTTIDGSGSGDVVKITVGWVNMSGFMITNGTRGIRLESSNNSFTDNTFSYNNNGIVLYGSHYNYIYSNNFSHNNDTGIVLEYFTNNNTITDNICSFNGISGIQLGGNSNFISNNTCQDNRVGISISRGSYHVVTNNTVTHNRFSGISIGSNFNTITKNNCSYNSDSGIRSFFGRNNIISNNICSFNGDVGIQILADDNIITNNLCNYNGFSGIHLGEDPFDLEGFGYNIVRNNSCANNRYGIYLDEAWRTTIENNNVSFNSYDGIESYGNRNIINNNTMSYNQFAGLRVSGSNNNIINNTIKNNSDGIIIWYNTKGNVISYNNFLNNSHYGMNATNSDNNSINATYNWWGDDSGPYHPELNPTGRGDNVTDNVLFHPWLTKRRNEEPSATIDSISPSPATEGDAVTFTGSGSDADGAIIAWEWRSDLDGLLGENATATVANLTPGDHNLTFRVMDDREAWSAAATATLHVNVRPYVVELNVSHDRANEGDSVTFFAFARDPDGSVVRYRWNSSLRSYPLTPREDGGPFSLDNLTPGDHIISVQALDDSGAWSVPATASLHVNARPTAEIVQIPQLEGCRGQKLQVNFTARANDPDGTIVVYQWDLDGDGIYESTGPEVAVNYTLNTATPRDFSPRLMVQDSEGAWSEEATIVVYVSIKTDCEELSPPTDSDDDGFLPGPGAAAALAAMSLAALLAPRYPRRR